MASIHCPPFSSQNETNGNTSLFLFLQTAWTSRPITGEKSKLPLCNWPVWSLCSSLCRGQTQKACLIGFKLGFGVLQGVPSTPKTSNGSDLDIWFSWYFYSGKNMIMLIFSINFKHCYLSTYSWDIYLTLYLKWQLLSEVFRVPGIMFVDKKHLCGSKNQ